MEPPVGRDEARPDARQGSDRPLPPPPSMVEIVRLGWDRWCLRHPNWDATKVVLVVATTVAVAGMAWSVWNGGTGSAPASVVAVRSSGSTVGAPGPTTVPAPTTTVASAVVVDVAGAVRHPGPTRLDVGSRVDDAIRAAGGPTNDADLERVDRAALLADGARVYVPRRGQPDVPQVVDPDGGPTGGASPTGGTAPATPGAPAGIVNLNTATLDELDALPGVGPSTAQAIVAYREAHGAFSKVEDLLDVRGIGPAKFATLQPLVGV